ncbi:MAG TPA: hypothetical protein VNI60_02405 [Pyrinomonadaceae bacterium]|nr:hypothetical protein [Pyrinomonadaceae bacterium]
MKLTKLFVFLIALAIFAACDPKESHQISPGGYTGANNNIHNPSSTAHSSEGIGAAGQVHATATGEEHHQQENSRPQNIAEMMARRGEQDQAAPTLRFIEPTDGATVNNSTVKVKLALAGDLKGYKPMKDTTTGMGNHIHVILDNQPYEAFYNLESEFELRNVSDGEHTLRVFPSRPWHESYKNSGAFQMIRFTVRNGGGDTSKPTTTNANQTMSNVNASAAPEGKDVQNSTAGAIDKTKPLLTYSRPKGEYKGADAENIMIDFWLMNAKLVGDGGEYHVRYSVDGGEAKMIDKWQPIWLSGFGEGKHAVKLELVGKDGNLVDNGGYNSTVREITVTK